MKKPPMPARLDPFGREKPKTEIVGVFENKREAALHTYGYGEAQRLFVRDTGVEPSWQAGFEAGCGYIALPSNPGEAEKFIASYRRAIAEDIPYRESKAEDWRPPAEERTLWNTGGVSTRNCMPVEQTQANPFVEALVDARHGRPPSDQGDT